MLKKLPQKVAISFILSIHQFWSELHDLKCIWCCSYDNIMHGRSWRPRSTGVWLLSDYSFILLLPFLSLHLHSYFVSTFQLYHFYLYLVKLLNLLPVKYCFFSYPIPQCVHPHWGLLLFYISFHYQNLVYLAPLHKIWKILCHIFLSNLIRFFYHVSIE